MKTPRRFGWIIALIVLAHAAGFWALSSYRPMPPREPFHEGEFDVRRSEVTDPRTGKKTIYREYTVSTQLSDPAPLPEKTP